MRRHLFLSVLLALLVAPLGARCGGGQLSTAPSDEPATAQRDEGDDAPRTPTSESRREEVSAMDVRPVPGTVEPGVERLVDLAKEDLAQTLSIPVEEVEVLEVKSVEWSDASLGCPQPGMVYAQVVTPGFSVVLGVEGERHTYHTDKQREVVYCEPREAPTLLRSVSSESVKLAKEDLARRLGIPADSVDVVAVVGQEFPADAFYCRTRKERIARDESPAVIVGETILLHAAGRRYEYHASDQTVIFCRKLR